MIRYRTLSYDKVDWAALDAFADRTVFQTREWLAFLTESQGATPVVAEVSDGSQVLGYFTGAVVRKLGLKMLGSSLPGWTTSHMGFNLLPGTDRRAVLAALPQYVFKELGCWHFELVDRNLTEEDGAALGAAWRSCTGYEVDFQGGEAAVMAGFHKGRRRYIRRSEDSGLIIEPATDEGFADDYYPQMADVFRKQGLVPTYGVERVRALIRNLSGSGRLLLLRVREPENGTCVGTGIFPAFNKRMYFWGGAAFTSALQLHPNEPMHWFAMRHWMERGIQFYDMMGAGDYKKMYGGQEIHLPWFHRSRYAGMAGLRSGARELIKLRQRILGKFA